MKKNKKKTEKKFVYKHKGTGKYLEFYDAGDGEVGLILVDKVSKDCMITQNLDWSLEELLHCSDGGADYNGGYIEFTADDFEEQEVSIEIKFV